VPNQLNSGINLDTTHRLTGLSAAQRALRRASCRGGTGRTVVGAPGVARAAGSARIREDEADGAIGISAPVPARVRRAALG
jgi:hypothetical protein